MSLGPLMISLRGLTIAPDEQAWLQSPAVAGVILFSRNFASLGQLTELVDAIHGARSPPLLVAIDQEGGRVQRFGKPFVVLPPMRAIGRLYDEDQAVAKTAARAFAWSMAAELRAVGIDLSFAPVVDLDRGLAEVIGDRALHADATVVTELATEFVAGMHDAGMVATAKHFPTHAGARGDSHLECAIDRRDYGALYDDLAPYRHLISTGLHAVMAAHVVFPELDPLPASLSRWWITTQLREQLGFSGAIISDDMDMAGVAQYGDPVGCVRQALDAGCDLVLLCNAPDTVPTVLESLADYVNPASQLRLMRLRGEHRVSFADLHASERWRRSNKVLDALDTRAPFKLEG